MPLDCTQPVSATSAMVKCTESRLCRFPRLPDVFPGSGRGARSALRQVSMHMPPDVHRIRRFGMQVAILARSLRRPDQ